MIVKPLGFALGLAAVFLAVAAGLRFAAAEGMVADDIVRRAVQALIGLGLAAWANFMPKQLGRPRKSAGAETRSQAALRVAGWSMTLAGLAYAGFWAFAPLPFADTVSMVPVAVAMVLTLGYAIWCFAACRRGAPAGN
ncbi:hypothetical protein [Brevundimonas sp.]|uniref:hypothetical protein n=1 Tax=Brevundimonas sp. TaxID=1871086 RepID=UPI002CD63612|nr:hypothetical protein [Brevundimonas sp.]HWQ86296.1 hypothetical protein [Brevundimonas sp.]